MLRIAEVRGLPRAEAAKGLPVRVRGVVTWRRIGSLVIQDETAGIFVAAGQASRRGLWAGDDAVLEGVRVGSVVEIEGVSDRGGFSPPILPRTLRVVGEAPLPTPQPMEPARFFSGSQDSQRIVVRGVVQGGYKADKDARALIVDANPGTFLAMVPMSAAPDVLALVDAEVRLTGVPLAKFNTRGEFVIPYFMINGPSDLVIEQPAQSPPFESPKLDLKDFAGFRVEPLQPHRVRVEGTVTAIFPEAQTTALYIQDGGTGLRVQVRGGEDARTGDRVEAAGFVDGARMIRGMKEAVVRRIAREALVEPDFLTPDQIMAENIKAASEGLVANPGDSDGRLVRFEARLIESQQAGPGKSRLILATASSVVLATVADAEVAALPELRAGSQIAVTGVVQLNYPPVNLDWGAFRPVGMELLLRSRDDIAVLAAPPWWTAARLLIALAVAAGVIALASLWVLQLRRTVRRQALRIEETLRAHRDAELEQEAATLERLRLAGDLHDGVHQLLTATAYRLESVEEKASRDPAAALADLSLAQKTLERSQNELRSLMWGIHEIATAPRDFTSLLEHALSSMDHWPAGAVVVHGTSPVIPARAAGSLLLLSQEAVENALRHGQATRVEFTVTDTPEALRLTIVDNGRGFDPAAVQPRLGGGLGVGNMRRRVAELSGTFTLTSVPGAGTTIVIELPWKHLRRLAPSATPP